MLRLHGLLLIACLIAAASGHAQPQAPTEAQQEALRSNCRGDYQAYCANVPPSGQAAYACLKTNLHNLSSSCQTAVLAIGGSQPQAPHSTSAKPGTARPAATPPPLGPAGPPPGAASATLSPREELALVGRGCRRDYSQFCDGVLSGGGGILMCLRDNFPSLTPACRGALMALRRR